MQSNISEHLQEYYDDQYRDYDTQWRLIGGRGKARNIMEITKNINFQNVLDVGSGEGAVLHWLELWKWCHDITALEISESGVEKIKARNLDCVKEVILFDGYKIPFGDKTFDLVTCSHVIEHVEHYRFLLREIKRVSKYQVFEIPIDFSLTVDKKVSHFLSYGHINIFTPQTFRFLLQAEGFKILYSKNGMYESSVFDLSTKRSVLKKWATRLKYFIWQHSPIMIIKPQIMTVLCSAE